MQAPSDSHTVSMDKTSQPIESVDELLSAEQSKTSKGAEADPVNDPPTVRDDPDHGAEESQNIEHSATAGEMESKQPAITGSAVVESLLIGGSFAHDKHPITPKETSVHNEQPSPPKQSSAEEVKESEESTHSTFVNEGLALWETNRNEWLQKSRRRELHATQLQVDDIIDTLFATSVGNSFSHNVPLAQMVDILQDLWEAEGLDV